MTMRDADGLLALHSEPELREFMPALDRPAVICAGWAFREFGYPYLTAMIRPENSRSVRVAERPGMTPLQSSFSSALPPVRRGPFEADAGKPTYSRRSHNSGEL